LRRPGSPGATTIGSLGDGVTRRRTPDLGVCHASNEASCPACCICVTISAARTWSGSRGDDQRVRNPQRPLRRRCRRRVKTYARLKGPPCERCGVLPSTKCSRSDVGGKDVVLGSVEQEARLVEANDRTMARASDGLVLPKHRERGASECERITSECERISIVERGGQPPRMTLVVADPPS